MSRQEATTRAAFGRQPAQYLIFDIGLPIISTQVNNVILAVQNVLTLACSVRGGSRIPAFGISVINQEFRNICPLEPIRGNFLKITKALNYLSTQATVSENISDQDFKDYIFLAFNSALEDFKTKSELTSSNKLQYPSQLQVTFVTARSAEEIHQHLEQVIPSMNIVKLRKIHLLQLVCTNEELSNKNANLKGVGFIEITKLMGNSENLEQLFKTWLMDYDMDHEHLRLFLPSAILLRCDMSECLINPFSLPFGHRYQMQMDFCSIQLGGSGLAKSAVNDLPIYELEVIARMESSSFCQSQLFGQPARLYPTQCWRVDWEDLLKNQQLFTSLCKELQEREQYLLTKLRCHYRSSTDCLIPYFAIESDGSILLVNAVVPAELTLPPRDYGLSCLSTEKLPVETVPKISLALDKLQLLEDFDPSLFPSGLYNTLSRNLQHSSMNGNQELSNAIHPALDPEMPCKSRARTNKRTRTNNAGKKQ